MPQPTARAACSSKRRPGWIAGVPRVSRSHVADMCAAPARRPEAERRTNSAGSRMGSWGLAVALTLCGGQHRGPVGRRAGGAAAKINTVLDTLADTDEALAASPG